MITNNLARVFTSTLSTLFEVVLIFISVFYFLKDGERWGRELVKLSPLADKDDEKILNRLARAINGVIKGYLLIAVVQGLLMGVGLAIFGVPNAAVWGVVAMLTSLLPTVGTAFVSIPAIIYLATTGHGWQAFGLACWAAFFVGTIDNFLSPVVVGTRINVPPLFILFAVLGGIALLGPVGILIGPLAVSLLYTLFSIYKSDFAT